MLYLNGHNYKYAAEQMLLSPRDGTSRGAELYPRTVGNAEF